ncbi:hypothetical protein V8G54_020268 [Vigna mungo]|uniref:NnrU domain-containing protein n=1 Tax=Vigna mungo TaxID=3915 RepID=A0AAQ3NDF1_VIGMU
MASSVVVATSVSLFSKYAQRRPSFFPFSSSNSIAKTNLNFNTQCFSNLLLSRSKSPIYGRHFVLRTSIKQSESENETELGLVGEDSAVFQLGEQKISSWIYFSAILGVVLYVLNVAWIDNSSGYGKAFIDAVSTLSDSHEVVMLILILIFAGVHSGLASFRNTGEKLIGERPFRVLFAGLSLPLAVSTIVQDAPGLHQLLWISNFISFFFLYPSTFNLLEVAAVDKPKLHLWETGIIRITRHPQMHFLHLTFALQMVGQVIWCLAHTIWIGNSVAVAASFGLIAHHLFGVWNGDRRLATKFGEDFELVKSRTSVVPFAAILDGRQKLPQDFYKEFLRLPYLTITALTLGAYFAHPLMQAASFNLHW